MKKQYFNYTIRLSCDKFALIARAMLTVPVLLLAISLCAEERQPTKATVNKEPKGVEADEKGLSLEGLIELVMKHGKKKKLDAGSAENLGFSGEVPAKSVLHKSKDSPDQHEHSFMVVYDQQEDQPAKAVAIILAKTQIAQHEEKKFVSGYKLRCNLVGVVTNALRGTGFVGEVEQQILPPDAPEVQIVSRQELALFLKNPPKQVRDK